MNSHAQVYIIPTESRNLVRFEMIGDFLAVWSRADWNELTAAHEHLWSCYALWRRYYGRAASRKQTKNMALLQEELEALDEVATVLVKVIIAYLHTRDTRRSMSLALRSQRVLHYMHNYFRGGRLHASLQPRFVLGTQATARPEAQLDKAVANALETVTTQTYPTTERPWHTEVYVP